MAAVLPFGTDHVGPGGGRQAGQLGQRILDRPAGIGAGVDADEERLLDGRGQIDQ